MALFVNSARHQENHLSEQVECGQQKQSPIERKLSKNKGCTKSDVHIRASQASLAYQASLHTGSVIQQQQNVAEQERMNREAVKSFFRCAHVLARQHILHTTNFVNLVELVVASFPGSRKERGRREPGTDCARTLIIPAFRDYRIPSVHFPCHVGAVTSRPSCLRYHFPIGAPHAR